MGDARTRVIGPEALDDLLAAIRDQGFRLLGPSVRDGAIVYDDLESASDLPVGWTESQDGATYRLERRGDEARFGYAVGPHSWKQFLLPPHIRLWKAHRNGGSAFEVEEEPLDDRPLAFVGVRACELHAIAIQDRVFLGGRYSDRDYAARRAGIFVVAVNCFEPGGTCFCVSMGTGPKAEAGYDVVLTEILEDEHRFLVQAGTDRGAGIVAGLSQREATDDDVRAADATLARAAERMGRRLDTGGIQELLADNLEHRRWDDVAGRCLTCGNCTMVCPTCFCTSVEDVNDLDGSAERWRVWDSCFSVEYSFIHGGSVRSSARSRYRQWMTHKLATWIDQFDTSGCVGCGRCITWCPVGIDITEEVAAIRESEEASHGND